MGNARNRVGWLLAIAIACIGSAASSHAAVLEPPGNDAAKLVLQIQRADYEGDRAALKRLYEDMGRFVEQKDKIVEAKLHYWRGFALWRRALNGFNESADPADLQQDLTTAIEEFDKASTLDSGFVDAKVGAASCLANLAVLAYKAGKPALQMLEKSNSLLKEAEAAEPNNPRLLWVLGANKWYAPAERGGGHTVAIETYKKGLKAAGEQATNSHDVLRPAWGKPELLMNLAWASLHQNPPDLAAAEHDARAALKLVPYWHYVRDILLPDIEAAKKKR